MHRLNVKSPLVRLPEDSGHGAYSDRAAPQPWEPGWQLKPTPATGPEVDAIVMLSAYHAAQAQLEEQALAELAELAPKKRKCVGKPGVPPWEAP